jgi:hypothetical protein
MGQPTQGRACHSRPACRRHGGLRRQQHAAAVLAVAAISGSPLLSGAGSSSVGRCRYAVPPVSCAPLSSGGLSLQAGAVAPGLLGVRSRLLMGLLATSTPCQLQCMQCRPWTRLCLRGIAHVYTIHTTPLICALFVFRAVRVTVSCLPWGL